MSAGGTCNGLAVKLAAGGGWEALLSFTEGEGRDSEQCWDQRKWRSGRGREGQCWGVGASSKARGPSDCRWVAEGIGQGPTVGSVGITPSWLNWQMNVITRHTQFIKKPLYPRKQQQIFTSFWPLITELVALPANTDPSQKACLLMYQKEDKSFSQTDTSINSQSCGDNMFTRGCTSPRSSQGEFG